MAPCSLTSISSNKPAPNLNKCLSMDQILDLLWIEAHEVGGHRVQGVHMGRGELVLAETLLGLARITSSRTSVKDEALLRDEGGERPLHPLNLRLHVPDYEYLRPHYSLR